MEQGKTTMKMVIITFWCTLIMAANASTQVAIISHLSTSRLRFIQLQHAIAEDEHIINRQQQVQINLIDEINLVEEETLWEMEPT